MRTMLKQLGAATLLCFLAIASVPAQNTAPLEAATNNTAYSESLQKPNPDKDLERTRLDILKDIEKTRLDNQKDIEKTKLDNDKQVIINNTDSHKAMVNDLEGMVHDLAWNSWVLFAIAIFFFGYLRDKRRHETIRLMIEKGTPMTPELLDGLRKKPHFLGLNYDPKGYLCWGVTEVLVAIALLYAFPRGGAHTAGWIVLAVGVANLILWVIERAHSGGNDGQTK